MMMTISILYDFGSSINGWMGECVWAREWVCVCGYVFVCSNERMHENNNKPNEMESAKVNTNDDGVA